MRRISLALALIGAVAATGCSGGAKSSSDTGAAPGVKDGTFTIVVQNGQPLYGTTKVNTSLKIKGARVYTADGKINCGVQASTAVPVTYADVTDCDEAYPLGTQVTLLYQVTGQIDTTVVPNAAYQFLGWAGDCVGSGACVLDGDSDKYIVAMFAGKRTGHDNWSDPVVHATKYKTNPQEIACTTCHGAQLQGQGIALSCGTCHPNPNPGTPVNPGTNGAGHADATSPAFDDHGTGWSQGCQRCHTDEGFRDYIGVLASPVTGTSTAPGPTETTPSDNHLDGKFNSTNWLPTPPNTASTTQSYNYGPLKCSTCHNSAFGVLNTVRFPSTGSFAADTGTYPNTTKVANPLGLTTTWTVDPATAICAQCHQGRESTASVNARIASCDPGVQGSCGLDLVIGTGSFINPHYAGAAGTLFGSAAKMWAEYPGKVYTGRNTHAGQGGCTSCHDAHNGDVKVSTTGCGNCHFNEFGLPVANLIELEESRQFGFEGDIDGDGNAHESLKHEIEGLETLLYTAMKVYSGKVIGFAACYDGGSHPYFFFDNGVGGGIAGNGICEGAFCSNSAYSTEADCTTNGGTWNKGEMADPDPATASVNEQAFNKFTPRFLRASFNYKWAHAEAGAWAHNPRYAIEVLYDAIFDLNVGIRADTTAPTGTAVDTAAVRGSFNGHFGSAQFAIEPYAQFLYHPAAGSFYGTRGPGFSGNTCFQCHGGQGGFEAYLAADPMTAPAATDCFVGSNNCTATVNDATATPRTWLTLTNKVTGMQCNTCHVDGDSMTGVRSDVTALHVPPQKGSTTNGVVSFASADLPASFALCGTCHSGLENKASVDAKIGTKTDADFNIGFVNPHYFGAAGIILGSEAKVMYEYTGKTYQGKAVIWSVGDGNGPHGSPHGARCVGCHDPKGSKHSFEIDTATTVVDGLYHGVQNTKACDVCHVIASYGDFRLAPKQENMRRLGAKLLAEIQAYATANAPASTCYSPAAYPYFFIDTNADGTCQVTEAVRANGFAAFNPKLLKAAFNYQWFVKEPGGADHNYEYMAQALIDSIMDLNPAAVLPLDNVAETDLDPANDGRLITRPAVE